MRGCSAPIVGAVFLLVVATASQLGAAEPPADGAPAVVVFAVDPRAKDAQAMVDAVRAHLTGLPVRLVIDAGGTPPAGAAEGSIGSSRRILGTLTIDPDTPGEWVVSFTEPAIDTTLVRRIRLKPQGMRVALEEAAIVVRSMVEAILDGGHVGIARPAALPPEGANLSPAAASAPVVPRRGIAGTAGYVGTTFAPGLGWQSGVLLGLRWQAGGLYTGVAYTIFLPIRTESSPASLLLIRRPGSIVVGYEGASRLAPSIELELTADYISRTTIGRDEGLDVTPPEGGWNLGIGGQAGISWSLLPRVRLMAQGGVDWMFSRYSYVTQSQTIVAPLAVRPKVGFGLAVDLW